MYAVMSYRLLLSILVRLGIIIALIRTISMTLLREISAFLREAEGFLYACLLTKLQT